MDPMNKLNFFEYKIPLQQQAKVDKRDIITNKIIDLSARALKGPELLAIATISAIASTVILVTVASQLLLNISAIALGVSIATALPLVLLKTRQRLKVTSPMIKNVEFIQENVKKNDKSTFQDPFNKVSNIFKRALTCTGIQYSVSLLFFEAAYIFSMIHDLNFITPMYAVLGSTTLVAGAFFNQKQIYYEGSMAAKVLSEWKTPEKNPWFEEIIPGKITLGALPLKNLNHIETFKKMGISSVVTLVESFELEPSLLSQPVISSDWKANTIDHLMIETPDFHAVNQENINKCVEHLREQIVRDGGHAYVHCKAGKGRSAAIVVCYLLKYGSKHGLTFNSVDDAIAYVKTKRNVISISQRHKQAITEYKNSISNSF